MKRHSGTRRWLIVFSALTLMGSALAELRIAGPASAADPPGPPKPVLDKWSPTTQVYLNDDGSFSATIWPGPAQVPDSSSETGWSPIDTELKLSNDRVITEKTQLLIEFSDGNSGPLASAGEDGRSLAMGWERDLPAPTLAGDTATYSDVLPGVDATLDANPSGFEVNFVVASAAEAPKAMDIPLTLDGLHASVTKENALILTDDQGTVLGGADPALMWGSAIDPHTGYPTPMAAVPMYLVEGDSGTVLRLAPDPGFFTDPTVTYPVTIDPAVNLTLLTDTYVDSSTPDTSFSNSGELRSGLRTAIGGGAINRTFISFDWNVLSEKHVLSATLNLYETWSYSCTPSQVDVYSVETELPPPSPSHGTISRPWACCTHRLPLQRDTRPVVRPER